MKTEGYPGWGVPPQEVLPNKLPGVPQTGNAGKGGTGGKGVVVEPCARMSPLPARPFLAVAGILYRGMLLVW